MKTNDRELIKNLRHLGPSGDELVERIDALLKRRPELEPDIRDLFFLDGNPAKDPFFEVHLYGDPPKKTSKAYRYRPEGISLMNMPLARAIDYCCEFLTTYNETIQDRSKTVTSYSLVEYDRVLFPFLASAIIAGYASNSLFGVNISYHLGVFSFSFRNRLGRSMSKADFLDAIVNDRCFEAFAFELGIIDPKAFLETYADRNVSFGYGNEDDFVTIQYAKGYADKGEALENRMLFFIEWTGEASRKEIAAYFKKPDRTINEVLRNLIGSGKIERIGDPHNPNVRYRIKRS